MEMSMHQYIGARYVPVFYQNSLDPTSSEWEDNVTYEPLTWVSLANGNMYISKKRVPPSIGTPAQNGEYWMEAGQFNAYIRELQEDVAELTQTVTTNTETLQGEIDDLSDELTTTSGNLQSQITENANDITGLEGDITTINTRITNTTNTLQSNIDKKQFSDANRKYLFLGDSYYLGGQGISYTGIGWASQVIAFLGLDSSHYILTPSTDLTPQGTVTVPGFYPTEPGHLSFKSILENCASHLSSADKLSVTDIVVAGGYNDINKGGSIVTGIQQYVEYAKQTFPNAKLWCAHIGWSTMAGQREKLLYTQRTYRMCSRYGMTYIGGAEFGLCQDSLFISDGVHPTEEGYKIIGSAIANALVNGNGGYVPKNHYVNGSINTTSQVPTSSGSFYIYLNEYGVKTVCFSSPLIFNLNTNYPINSSTPLQFEITCDAIQVTDNGATSKPVSVQIAGGNTGGIKYVHAVMKFVDENGSKRIRLDFQEDTSYTASTIGIPQMAFTVPSCYM